MTKKKQWGYIVFFVLLFFTLTVAAFEIILPFINADGQILTLGNDNGATHIGKDRYAFDFTKKGCAGWGTEVVAVYDGIVVQTDTGRIHGEKKSYGNQVILDHGNGITSRYAHLAEVLVQQGKLVKQGDVLGKQGNTGSVIGTQCTAYPGAHVHFVMYKNGKPFRPESMSGYTEYIEWKKYLPNDVQRKMFREKYGPRRFDSPLAWNIERLLRSLVFMPSDTQIVQAVGGIPIKDVDFIKKEFSFLNEEAILEREEVSSSISMYREEKSEEITIVDSIVTTSTKVLSVATATIALSESLRSRWHEIPRNEKGSRNKRVSSRKEEVIILEEENRENNEVFSFASSTIYQGETVVGETTSTELYLEESSSTTKKIKKPSVVINEINWMGTSAIKNAGVNCTEHEWIELYNPTTSTIDLFDWVLSWESNVIPLIGSIEPDAYYLLAKKHARNPAIHGIPVDQFIEGVYLPDAGTSLVLSNASGTAIETLSFSQGWPAGTVQGASHQLFQPMARVNVFASSSDPVNWNTDSGIRFYGKTSNCGKLFGSPGQKNTGGWLLHQPSYYYAGLLKDDVMTLTKEQSPYVISSPTTIPASMTLRIEPGVVLIGSHPEASLNVFGRLEILGSEEEPVIVTSARDREYSDMMFPLLEGDDPKPGDWSRLVFYPGASGDIQYAKFLYGGNSFLIEKDGFYFRKDGAQVIRLVSSTLSISDSLIQFAAANTRDHALTAGLWVEESELSLQNVQFQHMERGVVIEEGAKVSGTSTLSFVEVGEHIDDRREIVSSSTQIFVFEQ